MLIIVIAVLTAAIMRFYSDVSQDAGSSANTADIVRRIDSDENGNKIFEDKNGLYGIADSSDRIIVTPEWAELEFAENDLCVASKRLGRKMLSGCIDYEGNIVVPFIYKSISRHSSEGFVFYAAESDSDGSCIIYDESFNPCFMRSWDSFSVEGTSLTLFRDDNCYTYSFGENGLTCTNADVSGMALDTSFTFSVSSTQLLARLDCTMLEQISESVAGYLSFAFTGDSSYLSGIAPDDSHAGFTALFPEDEKITSKKLLGVTDIFIYSKKANDDSITYIVSATADTEIQYIGENGEIKTLRDSYRAVMRFKSSDSGIYAESAGFSMTQPIYPEDEGLSAEPDTDPSV